VYRLKSEISDASDQIVIVISANSKRSVSQPNNTAVLLQRHN